jgi:hypothetical protein
VTDYALVLTHHADYAGRLWGMNNNDLTTLTWDDSNDIPAPTQEELDAAWPAVQAQRANQQAAANRAAAYATEADPLFFYWQAGEGTEEAWQAKRAEIRDRYPYVEVPS